MNTFANRPPIPGSPAVPRREPVVSNAVLGTLIFVVCETMMFAGLISAFLIIKTQAVGWPPPDQPRLPAGETAINTAALLASGLLLYYAQRVYTRDPARAAAPLLGAFALGAFFVLFQGFEWLALLGQGLTLTSSTLGSFFYLIVGMHALHAIAALAALGYTWAALRRDRLPPSRFYAAQVFWYFVVGLWPILYLQVYL